MSSQYNPHQQHPQQRQHREQQFYHQQQISKSKRSRSMDDFSTQMLFEQHSSRAVQKNTMRNVNDFYYQQQQRQQQSFSTRPNYNNALIRSSNHQIQQLTKNKSHMRHSVDNLLEIDTSYYNNLHQVRIDLLYTFCILFYKRNWVSLSRKS